MAAPITQNPILRRTCQSWSRRIREPRDAGDDLLQIGTQQRLSPGESHLANALINKQ
jgi:hypothetical protein